jgi:RNA polymerase sigma factor (sigma-70 family)
VVKREQSRLRNFIRRRVPDPRDAEDILQEVFYELVEANRLLMPIEHVTGWLFRVARNRIIDLFRKKKPESFSDAARPDEDEELLLPWKTCCLRPMPGRTRFTPAACSSTNWSLRSTSCRRSSARCLSAHELEGRSFKEIAAETGVSVNTLLSRKRYAVLHLRERLQAFTTSLRKHEELNMRKKMDFHGPAGDSGDTAVYLHRRRDRAASVELAAAAALRLASDHLLAGGWNSGAVPHPLRRARAGTEESNC